MGQKPRSRRRRAPRAPAEMCVQSPSLSTRRTSRCGSSFPVCGQPPCSQTLLVATRLQTGTDQAPPPRLLPRLHGVPVSPPPCSRSTRVSRSDFPPHLPVAPALSEANGDSAAAVPAASGALRTVPPCTPDPHASPRPGHPLHVQTPHCPRAMPSSLPNLRPTRKRLVFLFLVNVSKALRCIVVGTEFQILSSDLFQPSPSP